MTSIAPWPAKFPTRADAPAFAVARRGGLVWLFALSCFLPYPAIAIGNRTGLQISHVLTALAIPALLLRPPGRTLWALLLILAPVYLSGFVNAMRPATVEVDVLPKEVLATTLAVCVLWPSSWLAERRRFRLALAAAAAATVLHAVVGLIQVEAFTRDEFPMLFLYRNPSFKNMENWAASYARYMKRPCGLFPEPSAMAAGLGPWLVVLAGISAAPGDARGLGLTRRDRQLYGAASAAGLLLLALSRSGAALAIMAGILIACLGQARGLLRSVKPGTWLGAGLLLVGALAAAAYVTSTVGSGLDQRVEASWGLRGLSIVTGMTANTEPLDLAFGVGPGQSTAVVRRLLSWFPLPEGQDDMAVWSLSVAYYMENGLIGGAAIVAVLLTAARSVARSSALALGVGALLAWVVGVGVTTSYLHLSSVWLFLGALLNWDKIFPVGARAEGAPP